LGTPCKAARAPPMGAKDPPPAAGSGGGKGAYMAWLSHASASSTSSSSPLLSKKTSIKCAFPAAHLCPSAHDS